MRCLVRSTKLLISVFPWLLSTPHEMLKVFIDCVIISYTWLGSCINILQTKIDTIISDAVMKLNRKNDTKLTLKVSLNLIKISYKHLVLFEWRQSQSQIWFNELMMFDTARHWIVSAYLGGTLLLPWAKITVLAAATTYWDWTKLTWHDTCWQEGSGGSIKCEWNVLDEVLHFPYD